MHLPRPPLLLSLLHQRPTPLLGDGDEPHCDRSCTWLYDCSQDAPVRDATERTFDLARLLLVSRDATGERPLGLRLDALDARADRRLVAEVAALQGSNRVRLRDGTCASSNSYTKGVAVGMFSSVISSFGMPSRYCTNARRELPWAAINTSFPAISSGTMTCCQYGTTLAAVVASDSVVGMTCLSNLAYLGSFPGQCSLLLSESGGGMS